MPAASWRGVEFPTYGISIYKFWEAVPFGAENLR
jgi:hypothetical protein